MGNTSNYIIKKCCFSEVVPLRKSKIAIWWYGLYTQIGWSRNILGLLCASTQLSASQTRSVSSRRPSHPTGRYVVLCLLPMIPSIKGTREETCSNQPGSVSQELGFENRISKWIPWFIIIWPVKYQYLTHITYPYPLSYPYFCSKPIGNMPSHRCDTLRCHWVGSAEASFALLPFNTTSLWPKTNWGNYQHKIDLRLSGLFRIRFSLGLYGHIM